jgi:GTP cyclohydrolase II
MNPKAAARAIDALRRGWPVEVRAGDGSCRVMAIEGADDVTLGSFDPGGTASLLISSSRAATLKLTNQRAAADPEMPVIVERSPWIDRDVATSIADPVRDLGTPLKGPFRAGKIAAPHAAKSALHLARLAGILPAFYLDGSGPTEASVSVDDIASPSARIRQRRCRDRRLPQPRRTARTYRADRRRAGQQPAGRAAAQRMSYG